MNILIIDDEPIIANSVFSQLSEMNEDKDLLDIAYSAEEARIFVKIKYMKYFCVILSCQMRMEFALQNGLCKSARTVK